MNVYHNFKSRLLLLLMLVLLFLSLFLLFAITHKKSCEGIQIGSQS